MIGQFAGQPRSDRKPRELKLGARDRVQLVITAYDAGLVPASPSTPGRLRE